MLYSLKNITRIIIFFFISIGSSQADVSQISAEPSKVVIAPSQLGATSISWESNNGNAEVRVSLDGGQEVILAQGSTGSVNASWIQSDHYYVFNLYDEPYASQPSATVTVVGVDITDSFTNYAPLGNRKAGQLYTKNNTKLISQWATQPTDDYSTDVAWGNPSSWPQGVDVEEWEIKSNCANGEDYVWINAYRNYDNPAHRFPIKTVKAILVDHNGIETDITAGGECGQDGQPYALANLKEEPYTLKVWGEINAPNPLGSEFPDLEYPSPNNGKVFYWEHKITPYQVVENSCWEGTDSNVKITLRQDEVWWEQYYTIDDSTGNEILVSGWTIGSGDIDPIDGVPNGTNIVYGRYQTIAKGTGYGWTFDGQLGLNTDEHKGCMRYGWSW